MFSGGDIGWNEKRDEDDKIEFEGWNISKTCSREKFGKREARLEVEEMEG